MPTPLSDRLARLALVAVMAGAFMSLLDTTIVNVALPTIQHSLGASDDSLEWVVSGYALAFGLVLIPAGRLGDSIGRKPLYLAGLVLFLLASLGAGLAQNPTELVFARIIQGLAAGTYYTQISATIVDIYAGTKRSHAFGLLAAVIGVSTAIGPLAGGLLISAIGPHSGWRWIFLVNLVIGLAAVPMAAKFLPTPVRKPREQADAAGIALLTLALVTILVPLIEGQRLDWPIWTYCCFVAAAPTLIGLWAWERRVERVGRTPLFPPRVIKRPAFAAGGTFALVYFAAFTSIFFILAVTWQDGFGHSALASGLVISPFACGAVISARKSHAIAARLGKRVLLLGCSAIAVGLAAVLLAFHLAGQPSAWYLVGPLFLAGLGHGIIVAPNIDLVLKSVPPADNGAASGVLNTAQRVGSAFGIAIIGAVLFGTLHPASATPESIAGAFSHSFQLAIGVNIGLILLALLLALRIPRQAGFAPAGPPAAPDHDRELVESA
jgi:EmrB/QacA subfamily drug resistance transporter